jgi:hypothetical protein
MGGWSAQFSTCGHRTCSGASVRRNVPGVTVARLRPGERGGCNNSIMSSTSASCEAVVGRATAHKAIQNLGPEESELSSGAAHVVAEPVEGADQVADGPEFPRREASLSIYNRKCIRVLLLVAPALKGCGVRWFVVTRRAPVQSSAEELRPVRLDMVPHPSPFTHLGMPNY